MAIKLIADSGSTKTEWCLLNEKTKKTFYTQGLSPYFLSEEQIEYIITEELKFKFPKTEPDEIFFYGTGCSNADNVKLVKKAIHKVFTHAKIYVDHDLMGAARSLCGAFSEMLRAAEPQTNSQRADAQRYVSGTARSQMR